VPIHIEEMTSDVSAETPPAATAAAQGAAAPPDWQELAHQRELYAQLARDYRRTAAEGFDD